MSFSLRRVAACAALLFVVALPALADDPQPWDAPLTGDPKAVLAAAEKIPAGEADVVVLLDEARYTFDAGGRSTSTHHIVYRVAADSAIDNWSTIEAPWAPWYQDKPRIEARVITKDGSVHALEEKALTESAAAEDLDIFSDNRVVRAPLPGIGVGSVVEQLITYTDRNPLFEAGTTDRYAFGRWGVPVQQSRLVLAAPAGLSLRVANKSSVVAMTEEKDGIRTQTFESGRIEPIDFVEWGLPYDESWRPYIAFSTGKSWQEIARKYAEVVDKQIAAGAVQKLVRETLGATSNKREVIARLLAAVQKNVRYAGVEVGESSIVPRDPTTVLGHKYGDCKDKATLLVAMLREAGIPASVALLRAGQDLDVSPDLPGLGQFNHAIVIVDGSPSLWIDPTDEFARAGELPVVDQGRLALVAAAKTTALVATPFAEASANHMVETRVFTMSEEGKATVDETTESSGADEAAQRRFLVMQDKKSYRESMEQYAKTHYAAKALETLDNSDPHDLTTPFKIHLKVTEAGRGVTEGGEADIAIFASALSANMPGILQNYDENEDKPDAPKNPKRKKRARDFLMPMPYVKEWHYKVVPPPGYVARTLPQNEVTQYGTATLTKAFRVDPASGNVLADIKFESGKRRLTATEFETLRKSLHDLNETKAVLLGFDQVGQTKLNAGDVGGALTEFRKLVALHPKEARHHVEIARALLAGGMGDAARQEAKMATEIEPTYARGFQTVGFVLEHDLFGREFRKGFDLPGAIAALRKAKELDSKDRAIRAQLAKLLELGEDGLPFGHGNHVSEAIEEYKAFEADLKETGLEGELLLALANAGRFAEMREATKTTKDLEQRQLGSLIATAALEGSAAALKEANALDQATRRKLVAAAGRELVSLRRYAEAADLLEQANQGTSNAAESAGFVEVLRRTKRAEDIPLTDDPKSMVMHALIAGVSNPDDVTAMETFIAADELDFEKKNSDDSDENRHARPTRRSMAGLRIEAANSGMTLPVLADISFAGMQLLQDGDEKNGYRIRMRPQAGVSNSAPSGPADTFYVIRDRGHWVLTAERSEPELIGWSVMRLADAGNIEAARQWLNWAREEMPAAGGDDPLDTPPFTAIWPKSKVSATADEVRLAAASLMLRTPYSKRALPILEAAREKASSDELKSKIDLALAALHTAARQWKTLAPIAERLAIANPDSAAAFNMKAAALTESSRFDEAEKYTKDRLAKLPKDVDAVRALGRIAMARGDYATCDKFYREVIDELTPTENDYNNAAWNVLFMSRQNKDLDRGIGYARQATTRIASPAALHTLAALYAESGKSLEAREALLKSMDDAGRLEPAPHDWYVLARIAENYGAKDAALAAYKRVEKQPDETPNDSTYLLAQRRLTSMK